MTTDLEIEMQFAPESGGIWAPARRMMRGFLQRYKRCVAQELAECFDDGWSVLDVGCDDGMTAELIRTQRPGLEFHGVDIQDLRPCRIPRTIYDGRRLPFADGAFDAVMAVDMLHHTREIESLVCEMARVARRGVVIKDHLVTGPVSWLLVAVGDAATNIPFGIPCAYNFPPLRCWLRHFERAGLTLSSLDDDLALPSGCIRRYNPLFRLQK